MSIPANSPQSETVQSTENNNSLQAKVTTLQLQKHWMIMVGVEGLLGENYLGVEMFGQIAPHL